MVLKSAIFIPNNFKKSLKKSIDFAIKLCYNLFNR